MTAETNLSFSLYQNLSRQTAKYPNLGNNYVYPALGIGGESGEILEKVKKCIRDKGGVMDEDTRQAIGKEIGDNVWYLAQLCTELGLCFSSVAQGNLDKLFDRMERGVIHGSGDNR